MQCLNATLYAIFSERRRGRNAEKKEQNAAEFLGSILHHANSFSMLWVRTAIGIIWHCNALQIVNMLSVKVCTRRSGPFVSQRWYLLWVTKILQRSKQVNLMVPDQNYMVDADCGSNLLNNKYTFRNRFSRFFSNFSSQLTLMFGKLLLIPFSFDKIIEPETPLSDCLSMMPPAVSSNSLNSIKTTIAMVKIT